MANDLKNDGELEELGLRRVIKYCCLFWDETNGWTCEIEDSEELANIQCGYGNFAGMGKITCIAPVDVI